MGFAVDEGDEWFNSLLKPSMWFNSGLPVGAHEWANLIDHYHSGARSLALFLYHPNTFPIAVDYGKQRKSGRNAFDYFGWKTNYMDCLCLELKNIRKINAAKSDGRKIIYQSGRRSWRFDSAYCNVVPKNTKSEISEASKDLYRLLNTFSNVLCVRVPIKEQIMPEALVNPYFLAARSAYDELWSYTRQLLRDHRNIKFHELSGFELDHYHGFDTHLNRAGNFRLRIAVGELLATYGYDDLCL